MIIRSFFVYIKHFFLKIKHYVSVFHRDCTRDFIRVNRGSRTNKNCNLFRIRIHRTEIIIAHNNLRKYAKLRLF